MHEEWLTVKEAAARLKVHPGAIRVWLREGAIQGAQPMQRRIGWRIPSKEVERVLRGGFDE